MPRAEVGTTKHLNNKLKSKGLQRLRWYCQACERQMRDENGFKCHTSSETHVRQMLLIGENAAKHINDYSGQFQRDFLTLLRTAHGEKKINMNHFYQEYIANKEHVHMNATRWPSLTEFAKYLGREGICRVEEGDKGLEVAWIDNSPEALRRQDAIRKKERQDRGDEERERKLIREQVERARRDAEERDGGEDEAGEEEKTLQREDGKKIKLTFSTKAALAVGPTSLSTPSTGAEPGSESSALPLLFSIKTPAAGTSTALPIPEIGTEPETQSSTSPPASALPEKLTPKLPSSKPKNVFAAASKKSAFSGAQAAAKAAPQKPMSEAERIMKEEIERKRLRETKSFSGLGPKRIKLA